MAKTKTKAARKTYEKAPLLGVLLARELSEVLLAQTCTDEPKMTCARIALLSAADFETRRETDDPSTTEVEVLTAIVLGHVQIETGEILNDDMVIDLASGVRRAFTSTMNGVFR